MKKTRKALLAVLACSAALAGAVGLAACGGGDDGDNGNSHDHTWGNWTVATQPTNEATCNATRTCSGEGTCDAAATDKEYTLPVLSSTDYTKGNDTATCSAGGSVEYTFDKDGVSVSFTVTTAVNATEHNYGEYVNDDPEGHYKVCSGNSAHTTDKEAHDTAGTDGACSVCEYKHVHKWSSWTVAEEDEPTAESTGKATRTCSGAGDCDATAADKEYELPMLNETDYTVIQTGRASCVENGRFSYVFEKDGVSAIFLVTTDVDSHAHSLEFHEGEESTCEKPGREDYYACGKCGKLFSDEEGQEEIEEEDVLIPANGHDIDEVPAHNASTSPNTKALKYPNNSAASATGMAHYKCNVCEKTFKDAEGENEITSTYALARAGMLLDFGANSVDATGVAYAKSGTNYCAFYIAESDGVFTFDFDEEVNIAQLIYM
ncbi:MAG: hypothetical protein K2G26_02180 [Clostridia bacterium]|nr:hypothetical protein [Clostridia bacterium]